MLKEDMDAGFFVEHFIKDMGIAIEECDQMRIDLQGLSLARQLYQQVMDDGGARLGTQALFAAIEKLAVDDGADLDA